MYLLDANACIHILRNTSRRLLDRFQRHDPAEIKLCSVVKAELLRRPADSQKEANLALLQRFFAPFECFPFDEESADHYGRIRVGLERTGTVIGPNNLMIASIARARGQVLVTHNTNEFSRVSDLKLDDWELAV